MADVQPASLAGIADDPAVQARRGDALALRKALLEARADTLATFAAVEAALPSLRVPQRPELNLPLWELGHIGWFQAYWLHRNPQRQLGHRADPAAPRGEPLRAAADAWYDSSRVPHASRWALPLPDAEATRADLRAQLAQTLELMSTLPADADDDALYFFRLALHHEDMHHEAALYMAQNLGVPIGDPRWQPRPLPDPPPPLPFLADTWRLGSAPGPGFVFDNELGAHEVATVAFQIDAQVRRWADLLPFFDAGGTPPAVLRRAGRSSGGWQRLHYGHWIELDPALPACHLSLADAQAWCAWAGRRLATEAEWERAAVSCPAGFRRGDVWEWTASAFAPYPGFAPHPYRDYSAPWFDGRPVLRGGSFMTQPRMKHPRYRNYFPGTRCDVPAGFRSCER
jgi:EgtB-related family protein